MRKPAVLMLGWEFPPHITGGLGIASYHMAVSLRRHASITLVLPKVAPGLRIPGIRLISIAQYPPEKLFSVRELHQIEKEIPEQPVHLDVSPYPAAVRGNKRKKNKTVEWTGGHRPASFVNPLDDTELYGERVIEKVSYFARACKKISKKIDFDLIHAHDWMTFPAAIALKEMTGKPLVVHIHSLTYDRIGPGDQGWVFRVEKEALSMADLILPVSHYTGEIIHEHYGIAKNKIWPVHNGARRIKTFRRDKKFPEKMILFLGRITFQKGPEYFLAMAQLIIEQFRNVRFVIAGDGDRFSRLVEDSAFRELGSKIHFTGFVDRPKVHELFAMADAFVMPSVSEPFGLAALEAAQFGVPVILSRRSGAAEVLKGAVVADYWDIEKMVRSIVKILSDEKYRQSIIRRQRDDLKQVTWNHTALRIKEAYTRLIPS